MENIAGLQFSLEELEGLNRNMKVIVPPAPIEEEVQKRLQKLAKTSRMNGFRPGKVPFTVIAKRFNEGVRQEVIGETMQSSFYQAVTEKELQPAGFPHIEIVQNEAGKGLEYLAKFEVYPKIELADLSVVTLEKEVVEITEQDLDTMVETLRKQRTTWNTVERAATTGDRVKIDLVGSVDGKEFEGGQAEGIELVIGSNMMPEGFEEQLKGVSAGDEKEITDTLPETYPNPDLAAKNAVFKVTIHGVKEPQLPEVDEEFIKAFGVEDGSIVGLRKEIRNNMQRELDLRLKSTLKNRALDLVLENNALSVPNALIEGELHKMMHKNQAPEHAHHHNHDDATTEQKADARKRVALGMLLAEVIQQQKISPDAAQIRAEIEKIAAPFEDKEMVINWYYADEQRLDEIQNLVLENQVVDWIVGQMKIKEKPATFDQVMNPGKSY